MKKIASAVLTGMLAMGALSLAAAPAASAEEECYNQGAPSSLIHDNHELAPAPLDEVVHDADQALCENDL